MTARHLSDTVVAPRPSAALVDVAKRLAVHHEISVAAGLDCLERMVDVLGTNLPTEPDQPAFHAQELACALLREALKILPGQLAIEILDKEDLVHLVTRLQAAAYLMREDVPFFSALELSGHAQAFDAFLTDSRDYLVTHGVPPRYFRACPWLHVQLARLYPTRISSAPYPFDELFSSQAESLRDQKAPFIWCRVPDSPAYLLSEVKRACSYGEASLLRGMTREDGARVERDRSRLFDAKVAVVRCLSDRSTPSLTPDDLWKDCVAELSKVLEADDVEFYLDMDRWYLGDDSCSGDGTVWSRERSPGGLTNLLDVVGWFVAELNTKIFERAKLAENGILTTVLSSLAEKEHDRQWSYLSVLADSERSRLDRALDEFVANVEHARREMIVLAAQMEVDLNRTFSVQAIFALPPKYVLPIPVPASTGNKANQDATNSSDNVFKRKTNGWEIRFQCSEVHRYPDLDGLLYLSELIAHPKRLFSAQELSSAKNLLNMKPTAAGASTFATTSNECDAGSHRLSSAGTAIDETARHEYKNRLDEIDSELEEAGKFNDAARIDRLSHDKHFLQQQLSRGTGLRGQPKDMSSEYKKLQDKVRNAINRAIERIRSNDTSLADHLVKCIGFSPAFVYSPDSEVHWTA